MSHILNIEYCYCVSIRKQREKESCLCAVDLIPCPFFSPSEFPLFTFSDHGIRSNLQNPIFNPNWLPILFSLDYRLLLVVMDDYASSDDDYNYSDDQDSVGDVFANDDLDFPLVSSKGSTTQVSPFYLIFPIFLFFICIVRTTKHLSFSVFLRRWFPCVCIYLCKWISVCVCFFSIIILLCFVTLCLLIVNFTKCIILMKVWSFRTALAKDIVEFMGCVMVLKRIWNVYVWLEFRISYCSGCNFFWVYSIRWY